MASYRIDEATKQLILDTASIVDVVADYVAIRKQGANFIGLCPFHNDRRPSFHVSPSKNICKCFACGEGGTPVSFLMKVEKITFYEALGQLARRYGIPIEQREETEEEKQRRNEAESMFLAQQFAQEYFAKMLCESPQGEQIALPYLRERGITLPIAEKFGLGYATSQHDGLYQAAEKAGYNLKYFTETGLCYPKDETKGGADRFRERVIFPIHTVSGKVVAFGGRIMKKSDKLAKYINSPESPIYSKSRELYGLYLAKKAITQADKCFIVEGYMDVIAMHQAGIENVVATSGTALTTWQTMLIRRFTNNVTIFYDGDSAGIKAALRGIDLLLEAGLQVRALPLPEGDDPDSFVRKVTIEEFHQYIALNEVDFIAFKTAVYKNDMERSPIEKANLINDLIQSVAAIPDPIQRSITAQSLAQDLQLKDELISSRVKVARSNRTAYSLHTSSPIPKQSQPPEDAEQEIEDDQKPLLPEPSKNELALLRLIIRYGNEPLLLAFDDGSEEQIPLASYVLELLISDGIDDFGELFRIVLAECCEKIEHNETKFSPSRHFSNHENQQIASLAINLLTDKYLLSTMSRQALGLMEEDHMPPPEELLRETELLINGLKGEFVQRKIDLCTQELKQLQTAPEEQTTKILEVMSRLNRLNNIKAQIASFLGNRTIIP